MSEHYYSEKPSTVNDRQKFEAILRGSKFSFVTDAGVFSKQSIDYGSCVLIDHMAFPSDAKVLDVGCGYGPIGLTAAKLAPQGHVTMIDVNERAVGLAKENARTNGIANVTVLQSDLFSALGEERFDAILTNPPIRAGKDVVHRIYELSAERLTPQGALWVVIQKKQGAPSTQDKLEQLFERVEEVTKDKGYRIFKALKPK